MRVAVLGAGYAGVAAARRLARRLPEEDEIVVVDEDGRHLVQHEVHRVVRRPGIADVIEFDAADLLERPEVRRARVTDLDTEAGFARLEPTDGDENENEPAPAGTEPHENAGDADPLRANGEGEDEGDGKGTERLTFDYAVVTLGSETAFYGLPGVPEHAAPLKSVTDAKRIREEFLALPAGGRFVVGGAGLSGVQLAGELAALADGRALEREVLLLEMADTVAPSFGARFQSAVAAALADAGIDVRTGWTVERAGDGEVETDRGTVEFDGFAWTGGIRGDEAFAGDRPVVNRHLRLGECAFGAGDAVRAVGAEGQSAPAAAQTAIRQAPIAADNVAALVEHERSGGDGFRPRLDSYTYDSLGWVVSVGDDAVAQIGPTVLRGTPALAAKTAVGAGYLSKVGAVRRAADLVNQELGLAGAVDSETPVEGE